MTLRNLLSGFNIPEVKEISVQRKGSEAFESMPISDVNQFFKIMYGRGLFCEEKELENVIKCTEQLDVQRNSKEMKKIEEYLANPAEYFYVAYFGEKCGYGLIANTDIPKGAIVGIYSSEIRAVKDDAKIDDEEIAYGRSIGQATINSDEYSLNIYAKNYGDLMRFAMHLPADSKNLHSSISAQDAKRIMTANLAVSLAVIEKDNVPIPVPYCQAIEAIKAGTIAGPSYGRRYWSKRHISPCYFIQEQNQVSILSTQGKSSSYSCTETIHLPQINKSPALRL